MTNTPTDPLEAEIADLLNQVAYRGYVAGQRKDTGDAENLYIQSEIVVERATDRILALIHTREQQARIDELKLHRHEWELFGDRPPYKGESVSLPILLAYHDDRIAELENQ